MLKCWWNRHSDRPTYILPEYLSKQLREYENGATQADKDNALTRLASHCGDASVLSTERISELMMGQGRSLTGEKCSAILARALGFLGKGDRFFDFGNWRGNEI